MNVDEAIAYASKDKCFWTGEVHTALETLADEIQRLRAELAEAKAASVVPAEEVDCHSFGDDVEVVCKCSEDAGCLLLIWLPPLTNERGE